MPRILEQGAECVGPEFDAAAQELEAEVTEEERKRLEELVGQEEGGNVNSYLQTVKYLRENRVNMNFRQVYK